MSGTDPALRSALLQRFSIVAADTASDDPWRDALQRLQIATALDARIAGHPAAPALPVQCVVLGPTQSGKSTLVNLLLDADAAGVSALAGFTVHAQGFVPGGEATAELAGEALAPAFAPLQRVARASLSPERLACWSLTATPAGPVALCDTDICWDTPDFDAAESIDYREAVCRAAGIADLVILMLSKDKYADQTVWDMLGILEDLGLPRLVLINKVDPRDADTVTHAFTDRHVQRFGKPPTALHLIPYALPLDRDADWFRALGDALANKRTALGDAEARQRLRQQRLERFVARSDARWLAPVQAENRQAARWHALVDAAMAEMAQRYQTQFLDDDNTYDTFNRALVELLDLLEIPGIAAGLARTRQIVTWPARRLLGLGRSSLQRVTEREQGHRDAETDTLAHLLSATLASLQDDAERQRRQVDESRIWWDALEQQVHRRREAIGRRFLDAIPAYQQDFQPEIDAAARALYAELQRQPALLNSLRAARVSADAAAVVLAVKSGGLAATDLLLAPAMLSITSLLTESALGRYLDHVRKDLAARQLALVRRRLLDEVLAKALDRLPEELDDTRFFLLPDIGTGVSKGAA